MGLFRREQESQPQKKSEGITFEFSSGTPNYHPMQKSQEMMKSFRNDISEPKEQRLDRLSELTIPTNLQDKTAILDN